MALINCPECGRENVSDSAESCPNCGYGIKLHFQEIRQQEILNSMQEKTAQSLEKPNVLVKCPECGEENVLESTVSCPGCGYGIKDHFQKIRQQERIDSMKAERYKNLEPPNKPEYMELIIIGIGGIVATLILGPGTGSFWLGVFTFVVFITGFLIMVVQYEDELEQYNKAYELYTTDKEAYDKKCRLRDQRIAAYEASLPKCPMCKSTRIEKITTVDRAISIGTVGLASGKIGKQYKCTSCKHMW